MKRIRKVYLPLWLAWFTQLFLVPMWGFVTYQAFFTEKGRSELGIGGWAMVTFMLAGVSTMLFLMGTRKLPAYIIEDEEV